MLTVVSAANAGSQHRPALVWHQHAFLAPVLEAYIKKLLISKERKISVTRVGTLEEARFGIFSPKEGLQPDRGLSFIGVGAARSPLAAKSQRDTG